MRLSLSAMTSRGLVSQVVPLASPGHYSTDARADADEMISIEIADYTGPDQAFGFYHLQHLELDVQTYTLQPEQNSSTLPESVSESTSTRILDLPNTLLKYEWNSLVFDDALPSRLLRYMVSSNSLPSTTRPATDSAPARLAW